jgi:phosphoribosylamine--glycine ligase
LKILVVGGGGREHALVWKLAQSPHATQIWCAPGNAGIAEERTAKTGVQTQCVNLGAEAIDDLLAFAKEQRIDLTVVGPDNPLSLGIVDRFKANGLRIWGPNRRAAQFESSKVFSQEFMEKHGIPTAKAGTFSDAKQALRFAESLDGKCAVKADGLALGKGVLICSGVNEARKAIDEILVQKSFGEAGSKVVIQDHKRALDGDRGLNTGGMGAYCPVPFIADKQLESIGDQILRPWLAGCAAEGIDYRGILYPGVMLTSAGPRVLEFNARFGDPEAQVYLTRLENDLLELLEASVDGTLSKHELRWTGNSSVCVVMASAGYPGAVQKGKVVKGLHEAASLPNTKVFHAGTARSGDVVVTNGGRVLGVTAWANDLREAQTAAYTAVQKITFEGAQYRTDIGAKAI